MNNYWIFNNGQMCNQLYYVLQMYIRGQGNILRVQDKHDEMRIYEALHNLGLSEFIVPFDFNSKDINYINSYCQIMNRDFTERQLREFTIKYIVQSKAYDVISKEEIPSRNQASIHIRCTDYLKPGCECHNCFNRNSYLEKAFTCFQNTVDHAVIFSDDIEFVKQQYGKMLEDRFKTVKFMDRDLQENDLIRMSRFKNKILWNSTYSFWAGFIGEVTFSNHKVVVPQKYLSSEDSHSRILPSWEVINA